VGVNNEVEIGAAVRRFFARSRQMGAREGPKKFRGRDFLFDSTFAKSVGMPTDENPPPSVATTPPSSPEELEFRKRTGLTGKGPVTVISDAAILQPAELPSPTCILEQPRSKCRRQLGGI
jgi:hypothetical protein